MTTARKITGCDLYCGAGGSSLGAHWAGVKILVAMNHWGLAIESHSSNFGDTVHVLGKAEWQNLSALKGVDLLIASPECIRHSTAAGHLRWTPEAEGSRATAWQVYRYAKELQPRWLVVENVRQIRLWTEFDKWVRAIKGLGYHVRQQILNSADFGVPQNRIRWFLIGDRKHEPPQVTPTVKEHVPVYTIIDWGLPCPSIFGRRRPLVANTLRRIKVGLERFCTGEMLRPFVTKMRTNNVPSSIESPLGTVATGGHHALTVPYIVKLRNNATVSGAHDPIGVVTSGGGHHAVVTPYVVTTNHGGGDVRRVKSVDEPLGTVTGSRGDGLALPFMIPQSSGAIPRGAEDTAPTVMAHGNSASIIVPFLVKYYRTGTAKSVSEPLDTVTGKARFGLVGTLPGKPPVLPKRDAHGIVKFMKEHGIVDIGFRMFQPAELQRAMGFPDEYIIKGNKSETVKQLGNAVCPNVMRAIIERLCSTA